MLAEVVTSEYLMRRALREARFPEHAINAAMLKLFPEPGEDACEVVELLDPEADDPGRWMAWVDQDRWSLGPDPNDADHFQPSSEDLAALDGICEEIERRIEFIQAVEQDEAREREQIRSRRFLPDECFEPRILAGAVD
jgi:hypothetical protein